MRMHSPTISSTGGGKCSDASSQRTIVEILRIPSRILRGHALHQLPEMQT
jgi:hypothetical protein